MNEGHLAALEQAYESARVSYAGALTIATFAAAADTTLLVFGLGNQNAPLVLTGGLVLLLALVQIRKAGALVAALIRSAAQIESECQVPECQSQAFIFVGSTRGDRGLARLRQFVGSDSRPLGSSWFRESASISPFNRGITTTVATIFSCVQIAAALILLGVWQ